MSYSQPVLPIYTQAERIVQGKCATWWDTGEPFWNSAYRSLTFRLQYPHPLHLQSSHIPHKPPQQPQLRLPVITWEEELLRKICSRTGELRELVFLPLYLSMTQDPRQAKHLGSRDQKQICPTHTVFTHTGDTSKHSVLRSFLRYRCCPPLQMLRKREGTRTEASVYALEGW